MVICGHKPNTQMLLRRYDMKKFWIWLTIFGCVTLSVFFVIFIIVRYWDKITGCAQAAGNAASKVARKVKRENGEEYEPGEYLEI